MNDLYQEIILTEFKQPHHFGILEHPDILQKGRNASCGDEVTIFIRLNQAKDVIQEITWQGQGCAISMATMSLLAQELQGKNISEMMSLGKSDLETWLGIDEIAYGREKCLLLGLQTVKKALQPYLPNTL